MVPGAGRYVDGSGTGSTVVRGTDMITRPEVRCRRHGVGPPANRACFSSRDQALTMLSPSTLTLVSGRPFVAGPAVTAPVSMANLLPWHGQRIWPPSTLLTLQP